MTMRREKPIEVLSEQEISDLIRAARSATLTGARARALIALLAYGGLRISEALALLPKDLDLEAGTISVLRGKGAKQRVAALLPEGTVHVERWLRRRASCGLNGTHPLFCTVSRGGNVFRARGTMRPGQPLARAFVHRQLQRLAERAGIERRVHPHGLRHSHAHLLASRGKLVTDIMQQLGHASLATTSGYLDSFAPAGRVERLRDESKESARVRGLRELAGAVERMEPGDAALLAGMLRDRMFNASAPGNKLPQ